MGNLSGKVAVVTGGSRGIGAGIVKRLAADGAAVAFTYASSAKPVDELVKSIEAGGGKALAIKADSADPAAVRTAIRQAKDRFGALDILINSAGALHITPIDQFPDDKFEQLIDVNVRGLYYASQEASKHLRDGGRIIHIGSVNSDSMPFPGGAVYAMTKGAVAAFTRGLARDLGPRNITVNNIQPGPIDTDMNPATGPFAETMKGFMAIKRYGKTSEIGALVSFLCSDEAAFITGAQIKIDGGFDA